MLYVRELERPVRSYVLETGKAQRHGTEATFFVCEAVLQAKRSRDVCD